MLGVDVEGHTADYAVVSAEGFGFCFLATGDRLIGESNTVVLLAAGWSIFTPCRVVVNRNLIPRNLSHLTNEGNPIA